MKCKVCRRGVADQALVEIYLPRQDAMLEVEAECCVTGFVLYVLFVFCQVCARSRFCTAFHIMIDFELIAF